MEKEWVAERTEEGRAEDGAGERWGRGVAARRGKAEQTGMDLVAFQDLAGPVDGDLEDECRDCDACEMVQRCRDHGAGHRGCRAAEYRDQEPSASSQAAALPGYRWKRTCAERLLDWIIGHGVDIQHLGH